MTFALEQLTDGLRAAMLAHAQTTDPDECCGLVVRDCAGGELHYAPGINLLAGAGGDRFRLDPETWWRAEEFGDVVAVVHSHPNASANPSMADRVGCEKSALPWLIVGWPSGVIKLLEPSGWSAPYVGREFHHGILDCYTEIQDWYWRELDIKLPDFEREDDWWVEGMSKVAQDLYMDGFEQAGFVKVSGPPQPHDVLLMNVGARKANHGAIYQGDGVILHHLHGRLSCTDVYGGYWERHTVAILRHRSRLALVAAMKRAA